ncbi:MAG: TetR/AcrR family transcriptional regulator [Actinomycetota bacterium]|nr:TetR/AcrR family transcriptional regulator [Actinomycetota bacterium]
MSEPPRSPEPAYTRLHVDQRRRLLIEAGSAVFAEHAFEEISMRQIADAAGISKSLLYHYFPSKSELFKAAVKAHAQELQKLIEPTGEGPPMTQLADSLDAYLVWIQANARTWAKLMQSEASLSQASEVVEGFRAGTLDQILRRLSDDPEPRPALRTALKGWLGYIDAAILDWIQNTDLSRRQLRDLLLGAFGAALLAAQQIDPEIELHLE